MDPLSSSPPLDSPQISVCLVRPSSQDVQPSPLLSSAQHTPCSVSLPSPAHTTSLFQLAHLIQEIPHPKKHPPPTLHHFCGSAFPLPAPPSTTNTSSFCLPGLSQGMKPPQLGSEVLSLQPMLVQPYI
ncbi:hypothetical protein Q8A73_005057 [Channa argus]|nr:hypothetical protein Q8A73_005057 [Channa argus]